MYADLVHRIIYDAKEYEHEDPEFFRIRGTKLIAVAQDPGKVQYYHPDTGMRPATPEDRARALIAGYALHAAAKAASDDRYQENRPFLRAIAGAFTPRITGGNRVRERPDLAAPPHFDPYTGRR